jgi:hypothetical protein
VADEGDLGARHERVRSRAGAALETTAGDERGEHQLGHVLGQRRDRGEDERRRPAEEDGHGQALTPALGHRVVEAAALADLPVHPGRPLVVDVEAVDA